jgi:meso-butanediol dehydrogenase / (S,S)-butanediol dehydrogenase / diacetyl reductase
MRLKDQVAVVTGSGQGLGRATAKLFASEGAKVVIAARTKAKLDSVQAEIEAEGGDVLSVVTDVSKDADVERLMGVTKKRFGGLDVLVNNAGIGLFTPLVDVEAEDYDRLMNTNLRGMFMGCKYAVPFMQEAGKGSIVNISSVHGVDGGANASVYAATKGGISGCTRALAAELAPQSIRVNTVSPGAIWIESYEEKWLSRLSAADRAEFLNEFKEDLKTNHKYFQVLEQVGMPVDIAYCALYLASDESRFVTGQNIVVDGGLTTRLSPYATEGARGKMREAEERMQKWIGARKQ